MISLIISVSGILFIKSIATMLLASVLSGPVNLATLYTLPFCKDKDNSSD